MRYIIGVAVLTLVAGCAPRYEHVELTPGPLKADAQLLVWSDGRVEKWKQVVIRPDSVTGVPYNLRPWPACDNCPGAIALAEVDSIMLRRSRFPNVPGVVGTTIQVAVALVLMVDLARSLSPR